MTNPLALVEYIVTVLVLATAIGLLAWAIVKIDLDRARLRTELWAAERRHADDLVAQRRALDQWVAGQLDHIHEAYKLALARLGNTLAYGTPTPPAATIDLEPTPEQSLGRAIEQDTIARGMDALRLEFQSAGIAITEEELRDQVMAIILNQPIPEPASVQGLIRH